MAITRIKMNTVASPSGAYIFSLNPTRLDVNDSQESNIERTLDSGVVIQRTYHDARPITMSWVRIPLDFGHDSSTLFNTLKGYLNTIRYINFGDAGYGVVGTAEWVKTRVTDLQVKAEPGGKVKRNVTLTLTPEV